ncbi:protein phosphatase regulator [Tilletia horrida]|uniref:Protein phosphatase regulator n=1 Tax=Tilletia horrida TaxID=155126 RepID=A0AAN6GAN6_9BASI|nr:protein phosphatase regulator [Tilletia horrida]
MAQRPSLTVDINVARQQGSRNQAAKSAQQAQASAGSHIAGNGAAAGGQGASSGGMQAGTHRIIEAPPELQGQDGFSSDEDDAQGEDMYAAAQARLKAGSASAGARATRNGNGSGEQQQQQQQQAQQQQQYQQQQQQQQYQVQQQYSQQHQQQYAQQQQGMYRDDMDESDSEDQMQAQVVEQEQYSDDGGDYDEDMEEDEFSSSPSIPDENIDFDLVYALHNFIATVEGQATVHKGNSLTLLDDSNSYWWLVRVLRTQEVGYIPAENIETPVERLARLNKHRNVDLSSATDDDHMQVPGKIYRSHLIKRRTAGQSGYSAHSGKLSALSHRKTGAPPKELLKEAKKSKRGVQFGPPTYLEHSGNEMSSDEEYDDEYGEEGYDEDYGDEEAAEGELEAEGDMQQEVAREQQGPERQKSGFEPMEPDDGMAWDNKETERVQREQEAQRNAAAAEQRRQEMEAQAQVQAQAQAQARAQAELRQRQQAQMQAQQAAQAAMQATQDQRPNGIRPLQTVQQQQDLRRIASDRSNSSMSSRSGSPLDQQQQGGAMLPSQVQASRRRGDSESSLASGTGSSINAPSPSPEKSKKSDKRKSKAEEEFSDEKSQKKRSGVFSGLFSRKKDRKSGQFGSSGSDPDMMGRESEDYGLAIDQQARMAASSPNGKPPSGMGRSVQERDRLTQEAYQRQFLSPSASNEIGGEQITRPARPGSLIATPGSVPMLNVLRIFAGDDIDSDATFKTVLLNETTAASDLMRQALQRFRLATPSDVAEYVITVKVLGGDERALEPQEHPLQVFDALAAANPDSDAVIPSVKRSSVGSISSISSNLSLNPAIARLGGDFSDDHTVRFFLKRRSALQNLQQEQLMDSILSPGMLGVENPNADQDGQGSTRSSMLASDSTGDMSSSGASMRFALRLVIYAPDLPDGIVFDPQTTALVPEEILRNRGPGGMQPAEGIPQDVRERVLAFPRNTTVAEVIETGLDRFGIGDGVVEGGDDVEDRPTRNHRGKGRIKYKLTALVDGVERSLLPSGSVIEAYPEPPAMRAVNRRSVDAKRRSADSAMLLSMMDDIRMADPIFVLRKVPAPKPPRLGRALSAAEEAYLASRTSPRNSSQTHGSSRSYAAQEKAVQPESNGYGESQAPAQAQAQAQASQAAILNADTHKKQNSTASETSRNTVSPQNSSSTTHQSATTTTAPTPLSSFPLTNTPSISGSAASSTASTQRMGGPVLSTRPIQRRAAPTSSVMHGWGLDHLYGVMDAAARRRPVGAAAAGIYGVGGPGSLFLAGALPSRDEDFYHPRVTGLFAPPLPQTGHPKTLEAYAPVRDELASMDNELDRLLREAFRVF